MRRFYFLVFVLLKLIAFGQVTVVKADFEINLNNLLADSSWLYNTENNPNFCKNEIDDSHWTKTSTNLTEDKFRELNFKGFAWFRNHIFIDSSFKNTPLVLTIYQKGASEIYLNGRLVKKIGEIGSTYEDEERNTGESDPIFINPIYGSENVIAIKYSNNNYEHSYDNGGGIVAGFTLKILESSDFFEDKYSNCIINSVIGIGLFIFLTTIGFIHFLLFLFFKERKSNLYFTLFCMLYGYYFLHLFLTYNYLTNATTIQLLNLFVLISIPFFLVLMLTVLYSLFYIKFPKQFKFIFITESILSILAPFSQTVLLISLFFGILVLIEVIRVLFVAIKNKKNGAKIIGAGFGVFCSFIFLILIAFFKNEDGINIVTNIILFSVLIIGSIISIPVSMSIFLAWDFSQTNKNLKLQLLKNEELSAQSLAQEREKQELLANQNRFLEEQVEERTLEINDQKKELQLKNVEITDSINYSKHIQMALLPEEDEITKALPGSFILYQPKDIVSGDFYWFKQIDKSAFNTRQSLGVNNDYTPVLIAAADCTGHGVPGALMSLIAIENLNKAVEFENEPQKILALVNKNIKNALKQNTDKAAKDGMDIALCKIEQLSEENFKVNYSAANRPLWVIRKNATEIEELKATKTAIGGHTDYNQQFEQHTVEFKKGDSFYIFSDGYADQFGSTKNKKLTTKRFKEILLEINHLSPNEQKQHLYTYINNWRGKLEQIDDILIIGLKF